MDNDWSSNLLRIFIAAFAVAVLTLFAIAIHRQLPRNAGAAGEQPGVTLTNNPPGKPPQRGGAISRFTSASALRACRF